MAHIWCCKICNQPIDSYYKTSSGNICKSCREDVDKSKFVDTLNPRTICNLLMRGEPILKKVSKGVLNKCKATVSVHKLWNSLNSNKPIFLEYTSNCDTLSDAEGNQGQFLASLSIHTRSFPPQYKHNVVMLGTPYNVYSSLTNECAFGRDFVIRKSHGPPIVLDMKGDYYPIRYTLFPIILKNPLQAATLLLVHKEEEMRLMGKWIYDNIVEKT